MRRFASTRISASIKRRLARLVRRAHSFHRFAHHPLCGAYAQETWRIGRRGRVCAGCSWALVGCACGLALGLVAQSTTPFTARRALWALGLQASGLAVLAFTRGLHAARSKILLRATPTLLLVCSLPITYQAMRAPMPVYAWLMQVGLASAAGFVLLLYRRRPPFRGPCESCVQRTMPVCDGLRRVVQRERALHRLSGRLIERANLSR